MRALLLGVGRGRGLDGAGHGRRMGEFAAGQDRGDEDHCPASKEWKLHPITKPGRRLVVEG
jgi:hypothetical protein